MSLTQQPREAAGRTRPDGSASLEPLPPGRNFSWTLAGYAAYLLCQGGMLMALARLGSAEGVGVFALGLAISTPVFMFTNLGLRRLQATDATGTFQFRDYFTLRLITTLLGLASIAGFVGLMGYGGSKAWIVLTVGVAKAFEALSDSTYGVLQRHERMDRVSRSLILRGVLSLLVLTGVMAWTGSVLAASLALAVTWAAVFAFHDLPGIRPLVGGSDLRPRWNPATQGKLVALALPVGFVMMLGSLESSIPNLVIERTLGLRALGLYTALFYFLAASNRVTNALGESAMPRLARSYAEGDEAGFRRLLARLLGLAALVGLLGIVAAVSFGDPLLRLLYGSEFALHFPVLVGLMVVASVQHVQTILQYAMTAARYLRIQPALFSVAGILHVGLCVSLIPSWGLGGAVLALGAVYAVETLASLGVIACSLGEVRRRTEEGAVGAT